MRKSSRNVGHLKPQCENPTLWQWGNDVLLAHLYKSCRDQMFIETEAETLKDLMLW